MSHSRSGARQNACRACTKAKRACDRQMPRCGRCADRELECQYHPRLRRNQNPNSILAPRPLTHGVGQFYPPEPFIDAGQASISNHPLTSLSLQNDTLTLSQFPPALDIIQQNLQSQMLTSTITVHYAEPELSWFLAQDSWDIKKTFVANPASPSVLFKSFVTNIQAWLRDWATHGHNLFIHRHLYQPGLPYYLEDAYTTLAAYLAKTEETEEIVMQILENRATKLCQQSVLLEGVETLDTKDHLARTQALLVYTLIRLFDGCPRQRALAEEGLCTLAQWCCQMREAAVVEAPRLYGELGRLRPGEGGLELGVWQAWILSESLRRTWMIISATMHIYQMKKDGWAGCSGFLLFTTRQGLWEAPNAWRWVQQLRTQSPLFAQTENVVELMEDTPPTEMDAFTNQVLSIVLSPEAIDRWVTKTTQIEGQQPDGSLMLQQALQ